MTRLQRWTLRSLANAAALPCTAAELAAEQQHAECHTERYLEQLRAGGWVSKRGAGWQPTERGLAAVSAE